MNISMTRNKVARRASVFASDESVFVFLGPLLASLEGD